MRLIRVTRVALLVAALMHLPGEARAQASALVPLESRSYQHIDRLAGARLLPTILRGQRPYTRREFARLVTEARYGMRALQVSPSGVASLERILRDLELEYAAELATGGNDGAEVTGRLDGASAELTQVDSPERPIEHTVLGTVDAVVNPLIQGRGGRRYGTRTTLAAEAAAHARLLGRVVVAGHVRGEPSASSASRSLTGPTALDVRALNAGINLGNTAVRIGRQPMLLGQGMDGGLLASSNAPGLDMIHVSTDAPVRLPWLLRRLGPTRVSGFLGDLGGDQHYPHTKLAGWKVSILPSPTFEIGASLVSIQGGEGAPPATFAERLIDVFTIIDVVVFQDRDLLFSNKLAGVDVRFRGKGVELYADLLLDDFDVRRVVGSIWQDGGLAAGIVLPSLGADGAVQVDAEFQHTGLRYYEHGLFQSGYTTRRSIIGSPLGPRGDALTARVRWDPARVSAFELRGALERRSGDTWVVAAGPNDANWTFVRAFDRPEETRLRGVAGWMFSPSHGMPRIELQAGVERVTNFNFIGGASRWNGLGRVAVVMGFR